MMTIQKQEYEDEIARLRAEIDNLQAPRPAPTIVDIIGIEAFDRMVELYPSFSEDGDPTLPTDAASEVLWSCIRMMSRADKSREHAVHRSSEMTLDYAEIYAQLERATNALAEFAMRAAEESTQ